MLADVRFSPWLPVLLILALGAYLLPGGGRVALRPPAQEQPAPQVQTPAPGAALPNTLPPEALALFRKSRPATVRVDSVDPATRQGGIGTGFFINEAGQVLTAYHVVSDGTLFQVNTLSGKAYAARLTAFDAAADVALLTVEGRGPFPYLKLATRAPRLGETVLAIGNSGGDYLQPRRGQLLRADVPAGRADFPQGTLELSAPLAPGDSGGPIIDGNGRAIGVVSYIRVNDSGRTQNSYAVPVVEGNALITSLRRGEKRDVPVVGLVFDPVHSGPRLGGAVVMRVAKGSPGQRAGLRGSTFDAQGQLKTLGDVITSVNGQPTPDADAVIGAVRRARVGETVTLGYLRAGQPRETRLTLVARATVKDLRE